MFAVLAQEIAKPAHMLLEAAIGHIAAVAGKNFWLRQIGGRSDFVLVPEDEFPWFERRPSRASARHQCLQSPAARAGRDNRSGRAQYRMAACVKVQGRQHLNAFAVRDESFVLCLATFPLGFIAGK